MKRFRSGVEEQEVDSLSLAHVLMSISRNQNNNNNFKIIERQNQLHFSSSNNNNNTDCFRVFPHPVGFQVSRQFECKTCNRQFPSFQALGGHRASHKKPRIHMANHYVPASHVGPTKPKIHECPICGLEFSIGQALGGHMRRHRAIGEEFEKSIEEKKNKKEDKVEEKTLCLDLNLAPPGTELRKIGITTQSLHKVSSMVDCFL